MLMSACIHGVIVRTEQSLLIGQPWNDAPNVAKDITEGLGQSTLDKAVPTRSLKLSNVDLSKYLGG